MYVVLVLMFLCYYCTIGFQLKQTLYVMVGTRVKHTNDTIIIPVHELHRSLKPLECDLLLPMYCLTGCRVGQDKKTVFNMMIKKSNEIKDVSKLGNPILNKYTIKACTFFVASLYGATECTCLNQLCSLLQVPLDPCCLDRLEAAMAFFSL